MTIWFQLALVWSTILRMASHPSLVYSGHMRNSSFRRQRSWSEVAAAAGFADQAHLTREMQALRGEGPSDWAKRGRDADLFKTVRVTTSARIAVMHVRAAVRVVLVLFLALAGLASAARAQLPVAEVERIRFHSPFWVNLHMTLYATGLFDRAWKSLRAPIETHLKPYVDGRVDAREAFRALIEAILR